MIPLVGTVQELSDQAAHRAPRGRGDDAEEGVRVDYLVGTMIEVPRAAVTAERIAGVAEFFSFGTNDLTQMTFGYSRDDAGKFLPEYVEKQGAGGRPVRVHRPGRRGLAHGHGGEGRPSGPAGHQARHLRRARRRPGERGVLPSHRARLRVVLAVPRADRAAGGSTSRAARHHAESDRR